MGENERQGWKGEAILIDERGWEIKRRTQVEKRRAERGGGRV